MEQERLEFLVADLQGLNLLSLSFAGGLGGATVSEDTLDPALLLLVFGLGSFPIVVLGMVHYCATGGQCVLPWREVCLGLREDLAP